MRRYPKEITRHRLYKVWNGMKHRCRPGKSGSKYYGDRGISVCEEWASNYEAFYNWAIVNGYGAGLSIDRIDGNGNYSPENCRFADSLTQARNKRNYKGIAQSVAKKPHPKREPRPFIRGYDSLRKMDVMAAKRDLMEALNITTYMGFYNRLNGKVIPKVTEAEIIEGIFAKRGILEVWGK